MASYSFFVPGEARSKGSMIPLTSKSTGRPILIPQNSAGQKLWMNRVAKFAFDILPRPSPGPVSLSLTFKMARPKKHYTKKGLRPDAPFYYQRTDGDKLERAILDALTGIAYEDDRQVVCMTWVKTYTNEPPGVWIEISEVSDVTAARAESLRFG